MREIEPAAPAPPPPAVPGAPDTGGTTLLLTLGAAVAFGVAYLVSRSKEEAPPGKATAGEARYLPLVKEAAAKANVPSNILAGTVWVETRWHNNPRTAAERANAKRVGVTCVTSSEDAIGLAQVKMIAAKGLGFTGPPQGLCDTRTNIMLAARLMRRLYTRFRGRLPAGTPERKLWEAAYRAYNAGSGNMNKWIGWTPQGPVAPKPNHNPTARRHAVAYSASALKKADSYRRGRLAGLATVPAPSPRVNVMRLRVAA